MIDERTFGKGKKVVGFKELADIDTGEVVVTNQVKHYDIDINWEKVWLKNLLFAIDIVGDRAMDILIWFLNNRDYENKVLATKEMIIRHTGISRGTVYSVIGKLLDNNIIKELELGFQVNPNVIFNSKKAREKKITRLDVVLSYYNYKIKNKREFTFEENE